MRRYTLPSLFLFLAFVGAIFVRQRPPAAAPGPVAASVPTGHSPGEPAAPPPATSAARPTAASADAPYPPPGSASAWRPGRDPRGVIASGWHDDARPEHATFRAWTEIYSAAAASPDRAALVEEGVRLAELRREALARLIAVDPEAALASAVPLAVRAGLPAAVAARLEVRVSGRGELSLNALSPAPGGPRPEETVFRSALIDGTEYRAHVYGRRAAQATIADAALAGIAVDRELAVAESPVRRLEPLEPLAGRPPVLVCEACAAAASGAPAEGFVAYEYAGRVGVAANAAHFASDAAGLEAAERDLSEADNQPGTVAVSGRPAMTWTHGVKKVLIIRVDFPDLRVPQDVAAPVTEDQATRLFTMPNGLSDFYTRSSFGKVTFTITPAVAGDSPDVTNTLRLTRTAADYATKGDSASLHVDARKLAAAAGFAVDGYDRVGVVFPGLSELPGSKITYGGLGNIIGKHFWINGAYTFRIVGHELGHNHGLRHANLWKVSDGDPVSENGVSLEYGDPFDIMGGGDASAGAVDDFGPWNKSILQWIPDDAVTIAESAGTYRIYRFDDAAADLALPRALKIVRDPIRDYWIGYRRATSSAALDGGAYVLWGYNSNQPGNLLDLNTPNTNPADAPLAIGATFDDVAAGITLKPLAQGGSGADEWLDVQVSLRARVQWIESVLVADEQRGTVRLRLRRSANSSGAISVAYATEPGTATATLDYAHVAGVVSWAAGDMEDKFVDVPLVKDSLVDGAETFNVRLGAVTGGVKVGPPAATVTIAEPGAHDSTFVPDFINSTITRVLVQPDGSLIAVGAFTVLQDAAFARFEFGRVGRFKPDGEIDPDFNPGAGANNTVQAVARQADGRILIGGAFTAFAGTPCGRIARLNTDGSLDTSFTPGAGANDVVHDIVVQADGRILVGGQFTNFGGTARNRLVRLLPDGTLDPTFANPGYSGDERSVRSIALQPDGKILVAGGFFYNGQPGVGFKSGLVRLGPDGARDGSFDVGHGAHTSSATNTTTTISRVVVLPDGRILVAGFFTGFGGRTDCRYIARLSASGSLDTTFIPGPSTTGGADTAVHALAPLPDGTILIGGDFTRVGGVPAKRIARLRANGGVDTAFAAGEGHSASVLDLALRADGKVVAAGQIHVENGNLAEPSLWRIISGLSEPAGTVAFSADSFVGREGSSARLTVRRTGGTLGAIRVGYAAARGQPTDTAVAGSDYTLAAGTLAWADGETASKTILVPIATDTATDDDETFTVRLGEPVVGGPNLGERREALVTIRPAAVETQTITFPAPADRVFSLAPVVLTATASSELPVTFELVSGPATLNGDRLTLISGGVVTVRAVQEGNAAFGAAPVVERSFTVERAPQAIVFPAIGNRTRAAGPFTLSATAGPDLAVTFELVSGPATLTGTTLTPDQEGLITVRARQAGDARFLPAADVLQSFVVAPPATVTLSGLTQTYSGSSRVVGVVTAPPNLAVSVTYDGSATPPIHPGAYAVTATITDPQGAGSASGVLTVAKAPLTITANNRFKLLNAPLPALTLGYAGFVGGDTAAELDQPPTVATTATAKSKAGPYPITLSGGADGDYALTLVPGTLSVTSLTGGYEAVLTATEAATEIIGKLEVTATATNTGFTALLNLGDETKALSLKGTLAPATAFDGATGVATLRRAITKTTFTTVRLEIELRPQALATRVYRDDVLVAVGSGPGLLVLPRGVVAGWAGAYTAPFLGVPLADADTRPYPFGASHATVTVQTTSVLKLKGMLADGRTFGATLKSGAVSAARGGSYRLFVRPYGARVQSHLAAEWAGPAPAPEGFAAPPLPANGLPGRFVWKKGPKPTPTTKENHGAGFALTGDTGLYPWRKPSAATKTAAAVTLGGLLRLPVSGEGPGLFEIAHTGVDLGALVGELPPSATLDAKNRVAVPGLASANVTGWKATFTPVTGAFSGGFTLRDAIPVPGKPDKIVKRAVTFVGVLRQPVAGGTGAEVIGLGHFLVPPLIVGGETLSGEIRLVSPAP